MKSVKTILILVSLPAFNLALSAAIPAAQRQALIDLYNSTNGASWTNRTNWLGAPGTENTWYGVTTDAGNTTVLRLLLNNNNLVGTLPSSLGNLSNLTDIWLDSNKLTGGIPSSLSNLSNLLSLWISHNQLTGSIPPELGNLSNLQHFLLHQNQLTGSIPSSLGNLSNLLRLYVQNNQLTGGIPPEIGNLSKLNELALQSNKLTGSIPSSFGNLSNLQNLQLDSNKLTGNIPSSLGNLSALTTLWISNNQLTGAIPTELGNLSNLRYLNLGINQLTGSIPPNLSNLSNLEWLYLHSNQLTGSIPSSLGNLSKLTDLGLYSNQLTGSIPTELSNLNNLYYLGLQLNQLTGSIPPELGNMSSLTRLTLRSNQLTGSIPPSLGNLSNLQWLVLNSNQLTGAIPSELGNLSKLTDLWLFSNQLTGTIPTSLTGLIKLGSSNTDIGYNALHTSDATLIAFLNSKDPDWAATQTIAPANLTAVPSDSAAAGVIVSAVAVNSSSVNVSWTPIAYAGDTGGYRVYYATVAGGPYTFFAQTADKSASSHLVNGLTPGTTYYFVVRTRTDAHTDDSDPVKNNQNVVDSENSVEVSATTPAIPATITVNSPVGGEVWSVGSSHPITWTSNGGFPNVKIEYATDGGSNYTTVIGSTPNTGSYPWTIPNTISANCRVKISEAITGAPWDISDAAFSIIDYLKIKLSGKVSKEVPSPIFISYLAGIKIEFSGGIGTAVTDGNGSFSKDVPYGWTGTVTPSDPNDPTATFVPQGRKYENIQQDQTGQDFEAVYRPVVLKLSRSSLIYGVSSSGIKTTAQSILVTNVGGGGAVPFGTWGVFKHSSWISVTPMGGMTNSQVLVDVDPTGLSPGSYQGYVSFENGSWRIDWTSTRLQVTLNIIDGPAMPIGVVDTPTDGTIGIEGSVPVTGWAVDDIEVASVKIYRDPVSGEGAGPNGYVYIGDAVFVEGARPDVEQAYPTYPLNYRAGWGYMMLTNFLPNGGNGTFRLHAIAADKEGNSTLLGSRTITCDNAHAVLPFGAIDVPSQGGTASGNTYINYAWVLATRPKCIPPDGSTITAWVDGLPIGHPSYGYYRVDIATLFPGYCNANGAIGYIPIDTAKYTNGVHTIVWSATDSAGVNNGFGSRYFAIQNSGSGAGVGGIPVNHMTAGSFEKASDLGMISPDSNAPVYVKKGFDKETPPDAIYPDEKGLIRVDIRELERAEIKVAEKGEGAIWQGYLKVGDELRALPIGTTFDSSQGTLYWQPGPGFLGDYVFVFLSRNADNVPVRKSVTVTIQPKK